MMDVVKLCVRTGRGNLSWWAWWNYVGVRSVVIFHDGRGEIMWAYGAW